MSQHDTLTAERWAGFDLGRQILMIGNEMNRGLRSAEAGRADELRRAYERVLRLVDLTVACRPRLPLIRELLRWRELVGALYLAPPDPGGHRTAFRALLLLHPVAARQIPWVLSAGPQPR